MATPGSGTLVLAATPIGRVGDAPPRLAEELAGADVVAAEDTRRLKRLTDDLGITLSGRVVSYFDGNETARTPVLVEALVAGQRVVLVTDAGMPSVSDPGYRLVLAALEAGIEITAVPGPSAVLTALAVSGLPVDRFCFEGFLPRKAGERSAPAGRAAGRAAHDGVLRGAAPHRGHAGGDGPTRSGPSAPAAVCRELTKTHEEVRRGALADLVGWARDGVRGEVTLVVSGADPVAALADDPDTLRAAVAEREAGGDQSQGGDRGGREAGRRTSSRGLQPGARRMTRLLRYRHDGFTFDVTDQGPLDGDPVVLLHGWPERASSWRKVTPLLHARGLRTYAPDQRGYSRGARPTRRRDYALQKLVGRRGRADRDDRPARAPRRSRLGLVDRVDRRRAAPGPGPQLDRRVGAAPEGLPARDAHVPPGAEVLVHGCVPDPRSPRADGQEGQARRAAPQGRDDGRRRPALPRRGRRRRRAAVAG